MVRSPTPHERSRSPPEPVACCDTTPYKHVPAAESGWRNATPTFAPIAFTAAWRRQILQAAYNLPSSSKGNGQIVAIVDAYDNPNVASDLAEYRSTYGLPPANFTKFNQRGQTGHYPENDEDWGVEIDLDVEMVSASCPNCTIYLVEADAPFDADLDAAESEAVKLGAHIVSNSYSGSGLARSDFETLGITYLASAGDAGYGIGYPAAFDSVVAVGGTDLSRSQNPRGWSETVWSGTGSGCSLEKKPAWQSDRGCSNRTANDVSAVACPCTGVAEYDTDLPPGQQSWFVVGGTSVASPLLAGVFGLASNAQAQDGGKTFWIKRHEKKRDLNRITSGNNGSCLPTYLCTAGTRAFRDYSGPAGWGTPNGIGAF